MGQRSLADSNTIIDFAGNKMPDFTALNNFFDKIYVITLERAAERHSLIKQELNGLNYTYMYGADKLNVDKNALIENHSFDRARSIQHHIMSKEMNVGEIACSFSHRMVYEDVVKNKYNRILIMEDDVIVDRENLILFNKIADELPQDWGLWYLGFAKNEKPPSIAFFKKLFYHLLIVTGIKKKFNHTVINNLYPSPFSKHLKKAGYHDCAHAYAITGKTANLLLDLQTPVSFIADHLLAWAATNQLVKAFITLPKLINQQRQVSADPIKSYIQE